MVVIIFYCEYGDFLILMEILIFTNGWDFGLQIISAVLNTVGIANVGAQNTGGNGNTPMVTMVSDFQSFTDL